MTINIPQQGFNIVGGTGTKSGNFRTVNQLTPASIIETDGINPGIFAQGDGLVLSNILMNVNSHGYGIGILLGNVEQPQLNGVTVEMSTGSNGPGLLEDG